MGKITWSSEEEVILEDLYAKQLSYDEMSERLKKTKNSITDKVGRMKLVEKYPLRSNNANFKAIYQEYDWCYDRYINKGMTHKQMAEEAKASLRVIQKWCVEKHGLHGDSFKEFFKLSDVQKQLIISGTLGDGHIDKREDQPMYIECHAEDEKDYMFWKYGILKNICGKPPVYKSKNTIKHFGDKEYECKPSYRLNSRIVDDLKSIRSMSICEKIDRLNLFGLSTYMLDDGYRSDSNWDLCIAKFSQIEKEHFIETCKNKFGVICWLKKDNRYVTFDSDSSRKIDEIILDNVPNELDIIHKKILDKKLCEPSNYLYVDIGENKIGLSAYIKNYYHKDKKHKYEYIKKYMEDKNIKEITVNNLEELLNGKIQ